MWRLTQRLTREFPGEGPQDLLTCFPATNYFAVMKGNSLIIPVSSNTHTMLTACFRSQQDLEVCDISLVTHVRLK